MLLLAHAAQPDLLADLVLRAESPVASLRTAAGIVSLIAKAASARRSERFCLAG